MCYDSKIKPEWLFALVLTSLANGHFLVLGTIDAQVVDFIRAVNYLNIMRFFSLLLQ